MTVIQSATRETKLTEPSKTASAHSSGAEIATDATLSDVRKPSHAWHYTTAVGLIGIVSRHRLWATSAAYMNDRDEIKGGRLALKKAIQTHNPPLERWQLDQLSAIGVTRLGNPHDLFLSCAALDGDALTLWRSYGVGSEAEYAIDLDPDVRLLPVQQSDAESHPEPVPPEWYEAASEFTQDGEHFMAYDPDEAHSFGGEWRRVEYLKPTSKAADNELRNLLKGLRKPESPGGHIMPFNLDYIAGPDPTAIFKHPGFSDEREVRAAWIVQPWWRFVKYRSGRFGVTPYIEVAASMPNQDDGKKLRESFIRPQNIDRLPIRSVRIGPTRAADDAKKSLRALLDVNGYGDVSILQSSTPYR